MLNLPENKTHQTSEAQLPVRQAAKTQVVSTPMFKDAAEFDKITAALPPVTGLGDLSDTELDSLANRATEAFDDLMDLAMNVEARYSGRIFEVASSMLKNAIDAKNSKIEKKLKMVEMQLKKQALDMRAKASDDDIPEVQGQGVVVTDRNSLLEKLKKLK